MEAIVKKKRKSQKRRQVQYLPKCEYLVADPFNTGK